MTDNTLLLRELTRQHFTIPNRFRPMFRKHYLRVWDAAYALSLISEDSILVHEGTAYDVIFPDGRPDPATCVSVALSFRAAYNSKVSPAVIVRAMTPRMARATKNAIRTTQN